MNSMNPLRPDAPRPREATPRYPLSAGSHHLRYRKLHRDHRAPALLGRRQYLSHDLDLLLRHRLRPLCGYVSRLAALFDDPEMFVFLDHLFNARFNVDGCVPRRHSEAFHSRANLLPFPLGQFYADAAIDPRALASKTCHGNATAKPVVLAPVEVPAKRLVFRDALLLRHRLLRRPDGFEGFVAVHVF